MAPSTAFDARALLDEPGFTPGAQHFDALFELLETAPNDDSPRVERVLARGGARAVEATLARLAAARGETRARLIAVLGRLTAEEAAPLLRAALADPEPRVRRRAASALGRLAPSDETENALLTAFEVSAPPEQRAIAEALGKVGGARADARLQRIPPGDAELLRRASNARLLIQRRASRSGASRITTERPLPRILPLLVRCRAGLEDLTSSELGALGEPRVAAPGLVELPFGGTLAELFRSRIALAWGIRVALGEHAEHELAAAVAEALASQDARDVFAAWTAGQPRFRLEFAHGGHRRALAFRIADAVRRRTPELVNDPRQASWEITVVERAPQPYLVLVPQAFDDPRFGYRARDVPAASHPTIAAALARTAGARPDDVVWDPFVGSGLELVERARLGPYRALLGTDVDARALGAARENLERAGVGAELTLADATQYHPRGVSLILTNPPMGRRLVRDGSVGPLLDRFVAHAARVLVPGGRLIWLSPLPERTRRQARAAGFRCAPGPLVDMGGFEAELSVYQRL